MQSPDEILDAIHERSIQLILDSFLVLADAYRDQGNNDAADCLTWLASNSRYPTFYDGLVQNTVDAEEEEVSGFQWYAESTTYPQSVIGTVNHEYLKVEESQELFYGSETFADAIRLAIRLWPQIQEANQIGIKR